MADVGLKLVVRACGSLHFTQPNGGPGGWSFALQSGDFLPAIVVNGAGDISLDFLAGNGVDALACVFVCSPRGALAPSQLTTIAVEQTSDTRKRFTILREGGGGGPSSLQDLDFDFVCWSLPGR